MQTDAQKEPLSSRFKKEVEMEHGMSLSDVDAMLGVLQRERQLICDKEQLYKLSVLKTFLERMKEEKLAVLDFATSSLDNVEQDLRASDARKERLEHERERLIQDYVDGAGGPAQNRTGFQSSRQTGPNEAGSHEAVVPQLSSQRLQMLQSGASVGGSASDMSSFVTVDGIRRQQMLTAEHSFARQPEHESIEDSLRHLRGLIRMPSSDHTDNGHNRNALLNHIGPNNTVPSYGGHSRRAGLGGEDVLEDGMGMHFGRQTSTQSSGDAPMGEALPSSQHYDRVGGGVVEDATLSRPSELVGERPQQRLGMSSRERQPQHRARLTDLMQIMPDDASTQPMYDACVPTCKG
eukprot:scaffold2421_cov390-Prasinococcus_capsulatus_cf.AAC.4